MRIRTQSGSRLSNGLPVYFLHLNERVNRYIILLCEYVDTQNALCYTDRTNYFLSFLLRMELTMDVPNVPYICVSNLILIQK